MRSHPQHNKDKLKCLLCGKAGARFICEFNDSPALQQKLYKTIKEALNAKPAPLALYGCDKCGFLFNAKFLPISPMFSASYDNTQDISPHFRLYTAKLAARLFRKYDLPRKNVLEVGCGKGEFLQQLFDLGAKNILGFDPAYLSRGTPLDKHVIKKLFNPRFVSKKYDFVILRHVFAYIQSPIEFILSIKKIMRPKGVIYIETPSLEWVISNKSFFEFYYEYCSYFSKRSLAYALEAAGFEAIGWQKALGGQYWSLEAKAGAGPSFQKEQMPNLNLIPEFVSAQVKIYKNHIRKIGGPFVLWGAGAKGVTFLNRLKINKKICPYVIDINPNKKDTFIPITGQKTASPEILKTFKPKSIFIANPVYKQEIKKMAKMRDYRGDFFVL